MKKIVFFLSCFLVQTCFVFSIPAYPYPITYTQPNGDTLTIRIKGDERIHCCKTMDDYTLLRNKAGYLTYAQLDEDGNLQPSDFIATNIEERNIVVNSFLQTIEKNLFYSDVQKQIMLKVWEIEDKAVNENFAKGGNTVKGSLKTLCAFVQYPEKPMIKTMEQFEDMFNQLGYTGNGTGSVRDFFKETSYNKLDLTITLCGIYTAPYSSAYSATHAGELARWTAQKVAAESHINFADYDSNRDGEVDGFHFIFAGRGKEATNNNDEIWSHKSQFYPPVYKNGKSVSIYSCSPELLGNNISTIGVICHEMTHAVLGAPDFYDTNYEEGGLYEGTGKWDIMANGSWNGSPGGNQPPHHNMYTKIQAGWVTPTLLELPATIEDMPNSAENPVAYRINTTTPNEYFLLDNRQRVGFDASVPGRGLLIYRVGSFLGSSVNTSHPQGMYPVCASSTVAIPGNGDPATQYGNINSAGCPFPGTSNKTEFTDNTTPSMKSWANQNTDKPITNISMNNKLISFDFRGGGCPLVKDLTVNFADNCSKAILNWNAPGSHKGDKSVLWYNMEGLEQQGCYSFRWDGPITSRFVMADDFDVPTDEAWAIQEVSFYGYSPNSNQPEHIGIAIYKDNGDNAPSTHLDDLIYENANFIPEGGFVNGLMSVKIFPPMVISESGKYWISIYGACKGSLNPNKQYFVAATTVPKGAPMCRWDPLRTFSNSYLNWSPNQEPPKYPSMGFTLSGKRIMEDKKQFFVYRDGIEIAGPLTETTFEDITFTNWHQHTWGVSVACLLIGEGESVKITKPACNVGIEEQKQEQIKVYTYSNAVYIQNDADIALKSVEIYDMLGRIVFQDAVRDKKTVIPLQNANGIYCVKLIAQDDSVISARKVLIIQ